MSSSVRGWLKNTQIKRRNHGVNVTPETNGTSRRTEVVSALPASRLIKPIYIWPCFNCHADVAVSRKTFLQLDARTLFGVQCPDCLSPKGDTMKAVA